MDYKKQINEHKEQFLNVIKNAEFSIGQKSVGADEWVKGVMELLFDIKKKDNSLFLIGNGASCSMAEHYAVDFTKNGGIKSFSNSEGALLTCFSNDFSYETAYLEMLRRQMRDSDVLIGISSSGSSKNIVNASKFVKEHFKKSKVITFSGFKKDNPLRQTGDYNLFLNIEDYGFVESGHAYYLHMLVDFITQMR